MYRDLLIISDKHPLIFDMGVLSLGDFNISLM